MKLRPWMEAVLFIFCLMILGAWALAPLIGIDAAPPPIVVSGLAVVLGYVFAKQRTKDNGGD